MKNKITEMILPFVNSYLATAQWVTCDSNEGRRGFTKQAIKIASNDCKTFIDKVFAEFTQDEAEAILNYQGSDVSVLAGHDFFLTRNRHGAGFFDKKSYNQLAIDGCNRLTNLAIECGTVDVWISKNGFIQFDI